MGEGAVRVFVSLDMEGVGGVVNWPEFDNPGSPTFHSSRQQALDEVLAVVKGLHRGAGEVG
ncbi:M55 family metallopeptidase, partial [bacterium]|nr:M55 family metallopeptidase [bacterium]